MKKYLYILLSVCLMAVSCNDDISVYQDLVQEGEPVEFTLDFSVGNLQDKSIESRGGNNSDVEDIYLFIFEAVVDDEHSEKVPGKLKAKKYFENVTTQLEKVNSDNGLSVSSTKGTLSIKTTQGESFIYAFANIKAGDAPTEYDVSSLFSSLEALSVGTDCFSTLNGLSVAYGSGQKYLSRISDKYLMAGLFLIPNANGEYTRENAPCTITSTGIGETTGRLRFYRLDAIVNFNISLANDAPEGTTFVPTSYRIVNLPTNSRLMTWTEDIPNTIPNTNNVAKYVNTEKIDVINISQETIPNSEKKINIYNFSFYMFENRESPPNTPETWEYKHREQTKGDYNFEESPEFTYAPTYSTYVEIEGKFSGYTKHAFDGTDTATDTGTSTPYVVSATTKYRVHLGDFSDKDYSNFNTLRNYEYTYNIKVKGIDDIIVEVQTKTSQEDAAPGAIGEVLYQQSANNFEIDSHFEVRQFTVEKTDISDWNDSDFAYVVETCYGTFRGDYTDAEDNATEEDKAKDIYWVEFLEETSAGTYSFYPSEKERGNLMNVAQLLNKLLAWKKGESDTNKSSMTFTVFIDEYYYTDTKIKKFNANHQDGTINWKNFCNQPDRVMYIGQKRKDSSVSPSSITKSICFLSQKSIQTIYNTDARLTGLTSAWGTETIDETAPISKNESDKITSSKPTNKDNGYANQLALLPSNSVWSTYVNNGNTESNLMIEGKHISAYSCLQRNRDENGNGNIDAGEMKWYLAAVNQYGDLFIGEHGLSNQSRLYYFENMNQWLYDKHYVASTFNQNDDKGTSARVLAEEGFAYNFSNEEAYGTGAEKFYIRCLRNLGTNEGVSFDNGTNNTSVRPQNYVQVNGNVIDLSFLNDKGFRGPINEGELTAEHSHKDDANRLYRKFKVAASDINSDNVYLNDNQRYNYNGDSSYKKDTDGAILYPADVVAYGRRENNDKESPATDYSENNETGWRAPNQRELMILHFYGKDDSFRTKGYWCRTLFEWGGMKAYRKGQTTLTDTWVTGVGATATYTDDEGTTHNIDYSATHTDADYYQWSVIGLDPRTNVDEKWDPTCYRYSFSARPNTFGLLSRNEFLKQHDYNADGKIGDTEKIPYLARLRPVKDVITNE